VNSLDLAKAYSGGGAGLIFRLRSRSANQALAHRLRHGPAPCLEPAVPAQRITPSNGKV